MINEDLSIEMVNLVLQACHVCGIEDRFEVETFALDSQSSMLLNFLISIPGTTSRTYIVN